MNKKVLNTEKHDRLPLTLLGINPKAIERQEQEGQKQLVEKHHQLPRTCNHPAGINAISQYHKMGIKTFVPTKDDELLFVGVKLPIYWEIKPTEPKRDYTKFFTVPETAAFMAMLLKPQVGKIYLEPSAGSGNLVRAIRLEEPNSLIYAVEINEEHYDALKEVADYVAIGDFLKKHTHPFLMTKFDGCIANPPFGNGVDLQAHIKQMRIRVKKDGPMVMIVPDDYKPEFRCINHPLRNWSANKDGTTTAIKIIQFWN